MGAQLYSVQVCIPSFLDYYASILISLYQLQVWKSAQQKQ